MTSGEHISGSQASSKGRCCVTKKCAGFSHKHSHGQLRSKVHTKQSSKRMESMKSMRHCNFSSAIFPTRLQKKLTVLQMLGRTQKSSLNIFIMMNFVNLSYGSPNPLELVEPLYCKSSSKALEDSLNSMIAL